MESFADTKRVVSCEVTADDHEPATRLTQTSAGGTSAEAGQPVDFID